MGDTFGPNPYKTNKGPSPRGPLPNKPLPTPPGKPHPHTSIVNLPPPKFNGSETSMPVPDLSVRTTPPPTPFPNCPKCGASLPKRCNFCGQCGVNLEQLQKSLEKSDSDIMKARRRAPPVPVRARTPSPPPSSTSPPSPPSSPPPLSPSLAPIRAASPPPVPPPEDFPSSTETVSTPEKAQLVKPLPLPFQPSTKREYLVMEILTTERTYVTNLKCLIETLLNPLKEQHNAAAAQAAKPLISLENIETLFSNVLQLIYRYNSELLKELEIRLGDWSDTQVIGDAVRRLIPFLKQYRHYTANYEKAQVLLADLMNRNLSFAAYVRKWEQEVVKMDMIPLLSYLILPVQRIPRYNMLLRDLVKQTDESHPDYENLSKAVEEMENLAIYINDEIQKAESRAKMIELQYQFLTLSGFELITPSRTLLIEGELIKVCRKAHKPRQFFLFNDGLLYAEIVTSKFIFRKFMPVSSLKVKDIPDSGEKSEMGTLQYRNAFVISSSSKSFVVYAEKIGEKHRWLTAVNQLTEKEQKGADYEAPVWVPDDAHEACQICSDPFTWINRRHHCRHCGKVVCSTCSPHKLFLGETYPQRVCVECYKATPNNGEMPLDPGAGRERGREDEYRKSSFSKDLFRKFSISSEAK